MQNRVPKINAETLAAANFPDSVKLEWCPPGHGDIYSSLLGTGLALFYKAIAIVTTLLVLVLAKDFSPAFKKYTSQSNELSGDW